MTTLNDEIAAFDGSKACLETEHLGKWVVFHSCELAGIYPTMEQAAADAVRRFGAGPYLIRQVGAYSISSA